MTLKRFIKEHYDITEKLKTLRMNPKELIATSDIFKYDYIDKDDTGDLVKWIYYAQDQAIPVHQLLQYQPNEVPDYLRDIYNNYTRDYEFTMPWLE